MDLSTLMMLVALSLFQEAETPLGSCGTFAGGNLPEQETDRANMTQSIAAAWNEMERFCRQRKVNIDNVYDALRAKVEKRNG